MTWRTQEQVTGLVEHWNLIDGSGAVIRCYLDGAIELFEIMTNGREYFENQYSTVELAKEVAEEWT